MSFHFFPDCQKCSHGCKNAIKGPDRTGTTVNESEVSLHEICNVWRNVAYAPVSRKRVIPSKKSQLLQTSKIFLCEFVSIPERYILRGACNLFDHICVPCIFASRQTTAAMHNATDVYIKRVLLLVCSVHMDTSVTQCRCMNNYIRSHLGPVKSLHAEI